MLLAPGIDVGAPKVQGEDAGDGGGGEADGQDDPGADAHSCCWCVVHRHTVCGEARRLKGMQRVGWGGWREA